MEEKSKLVSSASKLLENPIWLLIVLVLVAVSFFAFGRVSAIKSQKEPVRVISVQKDENLNINDKFLENNSAGVFKAIKTEATSNVLKTGISVVGSKNGTKYHLPTCPGAKQIAAKNLITFVSIEEARAKGYTPASNCPGLK